MSLGTSIAGGGQPSSLPPSGAAGGDLGGTYPNPSVTDDSHSHTAATLPAIAVPLKSFLAANATNATDVMAAAGLSVTVVLNRKYAFRAVLQFNDTSTAFADGAAVDFDGSTATSTNFRASCLSKSGVWSAPTVFSTALATNFEASTFASADDYVVIEGSLEPATSGTFALRFAQVNHSDGTLTLYRGSHLILWDMT